MAATQSDSIEQVLFAREQIRRRVQEMAAEILRDLAGEPPYVLGLLVGGSVFVADLVRALDAPLTLGFLRASSYGDRTASCGSVEYSLATFCPEQIRGRSVLLADDICDSGNTLCKLAQSLRGQGAAAVRTAVMLDKPSRRACDFAPDYVGFTIPDRFVVGYGMDYADQFRYLPDICVLKPEVYRK